MKKNNFITKLAAVAAIACVGFVTSCSKNEDALSSDDAQNVTSDAIADSYYNDVDDLSSVAMTSSSSTLSNGRSEGIISKDSLKDDRFGCATVTIVKDPNSTKEHPKGTITIDFGTGCTVGDNIRKGQIIITYDGRRFQPGSIIVTALVDFEINGIKLFGTRTLTNIAGSLEDHPKFEVLLTGGKIIWPSGDSITREHNVIREWIRASNPLNDQLIVSGGTIADHDASGLTEKGKTYTMDILDPIVHKRLCGLPVSGRKMFVVDGKEIIIDYGDGTCDRKITVTVNGTTHNVTVKNK